MAENKDRTYYNRASLTGATRQIKKDYKILNLRFSTWDKETSAQVSKFFNMFLTEENNDRNRETLQLLGVEAVPEVVSYETVKDISGLGFRTVDLVEEANDAGYRNIKYINEPKFGQGVYDMRD